MAHARRHPRRGAPTPVRHAHRTAGLRPVLMGVLGAAIIGFIALYFPSSGYHSPDGIGYFAHLPAVWKYRNLDVLPWFERLSGVFPVGLSPRGYAINLWPSGTAMLWSWAYLPSLLVSNRPAFFVFTNFASSLAGLAAAALVVCAVRRFGFSWRVAAGCGLAAWFGTPLFFYSFCMTQSAHPTTALLAALFLGCWAFTYGSHAPWRWSLLGILLGIMALVRPQEALNGLVLGVEIADGLLRRQRPMTLARLALRAVVAAAFGYAPQLILTGIVHGSPLVQAQGFNLGWENFSGLATVLSPYHGVLWWTPAMLLGFAGLLLGIRRRGAIALGYAAVFVAQVGINAFVTAFWNGNSFGIRLLTGTAFVVGVGTAFGWESLSRPGMRRAWSAAVALCCVWTFMLAFGVAAGGIDSSAPYSIASFVRMAAGAPAACLRGMRFMAVPREPEYFPVILCMLGFALWLSWRVALWWHRERFRRATWAAAALVAVWGIAIATTAWNRPVYRRQQVAMLVTPEDQRNCFLLVDLQARAQYHRLVGEHASAERAEARARTLRFRAPYARWFAYQRRRSQR